MDDFCKDYDQLTSDQQDERDAYDLANAIENDDGIRYTMDEVMDIIGKDIENPSREV